MGVMTLFLRAGRKLAKWGGPVVLGIMALCAITWFVGPRIGLGETTHRLYAIGAIIVAGIIVLIVQWLIVRWRGRKMKSDVTGKQDSEAAQREADKQALRENMEEAIKSLKGSELGGGHKGASALYALPWYLIIGPSAAGKSTLLGNSGLNFPYASSEDLRLRGFGGTRNCDWWFADEAILLDTAGRYTTEEDDHDEWMTFLDILKRHRKRRPINGAIVAISVEDVLTADETDIERHVKIIRERIDELIRKFGMVFPVYLVFTKTDLIRGFESFFSDLSDAEREQVWGTYLLDTGDDEDVGQRFRQRMNALYRRLCQLRLNKLPGEHNVARKGEIYDFPAQFLAASETLAYFVEQLFRRNPYQETPMLAGVYFSSSTQEGTPLQRALGGVRKAFGLASDSEGAAGSGAQRPFFIRRLFKDVIFQLPEVVRRNRRQRLRQRWLKGATVATALSVLGLTGLGLSGAYGANALLLERGEDRVAAVSEAIKNDQEPMVRYDALASLFDYYQELRDYEANRPLSIRLGIYTVDDLVPGVERALFRGLGPLFRDQTLTRLEDNLSRHITRWEQAGTETRKELRPDYYRALRTYLEAARFNAELTPDNEVDYFSDLWARHLGIASADQGYKDVSERAPELDGLVSFYLDRIDREPGKRSWPLDKSLVQRARADLDTPPDAARLYARIQRRADAALEARTINDLLSDGNAQVLTSGRALNGLYTKAGWHDFMKDAIDEAVTDASTGDWVIDAPLDGTADAPGHNQDSAELDEELAERLRSGVRALYFRDYAAEWRRFLATVRPADYQSLDGANSVLTGMAGGDGAFSDLMSVVAANITLHERKLPGKDASSDNEESAGDDAGAASLKDSAQAAAEDAAGAEQAEQARERVAELEQRLTGLRDFATAPEDKATSKLVGEYLTLLDELAKSTGSLTASADAARDAEEYASQILSGGGSDSAIYAAWVGSRRVLKDTDNTTRELLGPLMTEPISGVWGEILTLARQQVRADWQDEVVAAYEEQLANRFPFDAQGSDASLEKVTRFFHPDEGRLWTFVDETLAPYVEQTSDGWRGRSWLGVRPGFRADLFRSLERAQHISDALFANGSSQPEVVFHIYPLPNTGLSQIMLETNGQSYRYRNGPQTWTRLSWPGEQENIGARVAGRTSRGGALAERTADGPWGIFHLFQSAAIETLESDVYRVEWRLQVGTREPVPVSFKLRAPDQAEVLTGSIFRQFRLRDRLFVGAGVDRPLAGAR